MGRAVVGGLALACASVVLAGDPPAAGQADAAAPAQSPGGVTAEPARVRLDQLLTLPSDHTYSVERKGGLTRGEWRTRYGEVRGELQKEHTALDTTQGKLEDAGGGQWSVNPIPGSDTDTSRNPIDFQLRTELRKHREEIDRLERKLRQLDIAANLAGVPDEWRR